MHLELRPFRAVQLLDGLRKMQSRITHDTLSVSEKGLEVLQSMLRAGVYEYLACERPAWIAQVDESQLAQPRTWSRFAALAAERRGKVLLSE